MLKACDAKYSVPLRYGKVLFCGAAAAGKSNFLNLLMEEDFQSLHISTEILKPQQVTIAMKAVMHGNENEVKFEKMNIDEEILQLESYLPEKINILKSSTQMLTHVAESAVKNANNSTEEKNKLPLTNVNLEIEKLHKKPSGKIWDILTFMDTGGQPQFISMLPAVNSFAMITFIIHKVVPDGKESLNEIVKVQYGDKNGEVSFKPHTHKYTYHQLIETLISYASNILFPDTNFLSKLKVDLKNNEKRSILLVGTHSGDNELLDDDIIDTDKELTKIVEQSGVNHVTPSLNKQYKTLVPVDNKIQSENSKTQVLAEDAKRYSKLSDIRSYIQKFLNNQDVIHVPIKWILLELEIRKVCQEKKCNLISYSDVQKLAKEKKLDYNGEFGDDKNTDGGEFIKQALRFYHSFGVLLYFEEVESMKKLIITNHQWLFNTLSKIIEYSFTCNTQEETDDLKKGIFKKTLLGDDCVDVNKDFEDSQIDTKSIDPINTFLNLLEHLRIAAPLNETVDKYFMPCLLDSCELLNLKVKTPKYMANDIEPLLIQFKSEDNKTYGFPRGVFCFLVVELMVSMKWEPHDQTYVNFLTLFKQDTGHFITLIDRIFCLQICVTYKEDNNIYSEVKEFISQALRRLCNKLKIRDTLCYGFICTCQIIEKMHISYVREGNNKFCWCKEKSLTDLTDSHLIWLNGNYKVHGYVHSYILTYMPTYVRITMLLTN